MQGPAPYPGTVSRRLRTAPRHRERPSKALETSGGLFMRTTASVPAKGRRPKSRLSETREIGQAKAVGQRAGMVDRQRLQHVQGCRRVRYRARVRGVRPGGLADGPDRAPAGRAALGPGAITRRVLRAINFGDGKRQSSPSLLENDDGIFMSSGSEMRTKGASLRLVVPFTGHFLGLREARQRSCHPNQLPARSGCGISDAEASDLRNR